MTIEKDLAELSQQLGHFYRVDTGRAIMPTEEEFEQILDEAVRVLNGEPEGTTLRLGRLIIEKIEDGFDVYIHVGNYK
jgi:hypothetical protein